MNRVNDTLTNNERTRLQCTQKKLPRQKSTRNEAFVCTRLNAIRAVLVVVGVAASAVGIALGDTRVILQKALFICLECIGIG